MIEIYSLSASIFLLGILLAFLRLRVTWKGKAAIFISAAVLSLLAYMSLPTFSYVVIFPVLILLAALVSYLVIKNVDIFPSRQDHEEENEQTASPLFSYAELKEKAQKAETIDQYYMDTAQLVKAAEAEATAEHQVEEGSSSVVGQDVIDQIILQNQLNEAAAATESIDKEEIEIDYYDLTMPSNQNEAEWLHRNLSEAVLSEPDEHETAEADLPLVEADQTDVSSIELFILDSSLEEIDYKQRERASSFENNEDPCAGFDLSDDEDDLIAIRKKLFERLEGDDNDDDEDEDDVSADVDHVSAKAEDQEGIAIPNSFSSKELEAAFDDLEESYLKRKANERGGG